jgi:transcription initiation factor TFIIE subunit alpha
MDLAVTLVKSVMRAFYQTREILVIDALILHEAYAGRWFSIPQARC